MNAGIALALLMQENERLMELGYEQHRKVGSGL